jgi:hypothetical protein
MAVINVGAPKRMVFCLFDRLLRKMVASYWKETESRFVKSAGKEKSRDFGVTKRVKELDEPFISGLR